MTTSGRLVAGPTGRRPLFPELEELLPEGVLAPVAHGGAADAEVERCEVHGGVEVATGRFLPTVGVQPGRQATLRARPSYVVPGFVVGAAVGYDAPADPLPQRLVVSLGVDLGEVLELVVPGGDRRRLGHPAVPVEPHRGGHVHDAEDVGEAVLGIQHGWQPGLPGPVANTGLVVVEGDGDQVET